MYPTLTPELAKAMANPLQIEIVISDADGEQQVAGYTTSFGRAYSTIAAGLFGTEEPIEEHAKVIDDVMMGFANPDNWNINVVTGTFYDSIANVEGLLNDGEPCGCQIVITILDGSGMKGPGEFVLENTVIEARRRGNIAFIGSVEPDVYCALMGEILLSDRGILTYAAKPATTEALVPGFFDFLPAAGSTDVGVYRIVLDNSADTFSKEGVADYASENGLVWHDLGICTLMEGRMSQGDAVDTAALFGSCLLGVEVLAAPTPEPFDAE